MSKYLRPLWVFLVGQALLLIAWLLFPVLGDAVANTLEETAAWGAIGWGYTAIVGATRLLVVVGLELGILYETAREFMAYKR